MLVQDLLADAVQHGSQLFQLMQAASLESFVRQGLVDSRKNPPLQGAETRCRTCQSRSLHATLSLDQRERLRELAAAASGFEPSELRRTLSEELCRNKQRLNLGGKLTLNCVGFTRALSVHPGLIPCSCTVCSMNRTDERALLGLLGGVSGRSAEPGRRELWTSACKPVKVSQARLGIRLSPAANATLQHRSGCASNNDCGGSLERGLLSDIIAAARGLRSTLRCGLGVARAPSEKSLPQSRSWVLVTRSFVSCTTLAGFPKELNSLKSGSIGCAAPLSAHPSSLGGTVQLGCTKLNKHCAACCREGSFPAYQSAHYCTEDETSGTWPTNCRVCHKQSHHGLSSSLFPVFHTRRYASFSQHLNSGIVWADGLSLTAMQHCQQKILQPSLAHSQKSLCFKATAHRVSAPSMLPVGLNCLPFACSQQRGQGDQKHITHHLAFHRNSGCRPIAPFRSNKDHTDGMVQGLCKQGIPVAPGWNLLAVQELVVASESLAHSLPNHFAGTDDRVKARHPSRPQ